MDLEEFRAAVHKITVQALAEYQLASPAKPKVGRPSAWTPSRVARFCTLYSQDVSMRQIAVELGLGYTTVVRYARNYA